MKHVVSLSGGMGSWKTGRAVAEAHGTKDLILLAANTNSEADDWMTCLMAYVNDIGGTFVLLTNDGKNIWDVNHEEHFISNTRVDVCSKKLKREPMFRWLKENCDPDDTVVYLGLDWTEEHRVKTARERWDPWRVEFPMMEVTTQKADWIEEARERGLPTPELYDQGFSHNNCGGACFKAGQAQWKEVYIRNPELYAWHQAEEMKFRKREGKNVAILRDRRKVEKDVWVCGCWRATSDNDNTRPHPDIVYEEGESECRTPELVRKKMPNTRPLPLVVFAARLRADPDLYDRDDSGGCACVT